MTASKIVTSRNLALLALTLIFLLAAALRIPNIDGPALWTDEGFTYYTFKVDLFEAVAGDRHPPFYFYTLHGWAALAGDSILALRWWSLLPSMLTVAVAHAIGRELVRWRPGVAARRGWLGVPVLAALMMALASGENYLAQELRMYTWHVLFAACATLFYLRFLRQPAPRRALWWGLFGTLLIYTHYFGAFVLLTQAIHALIFMRGRARWLALGALAAVGAIFAPWFVLVTLNQFASDAVCVNCAPPGNWTILLEFRLKWFGQQWPLTLGLFLLGWVTVVYHRTPQAGPSAAKVTDALPFSAQRAERQRVKGALLPCGGVGAAPPQNNTRLFSFQLRPLEPLTLLLGLIVIPIALTYPLGHDELIFFAHRLVQITVPVTLLLALGLGNLQNPARVLVAAALLIYGATTVDWYRVKVPWDVMADRIAEYARPGDLALAEVDYEESALLYYYDHQLPEGVIISTYPVWSDMNRSTYYDGVLPGLLAEHQPTLGQPAGAWVTHFSAQTTLMDRLEAAGYTRSLTWPYDHIGSTVYVYRYDRLPDGEPLARFDSGLALRAAAVHADALRIDLWWQADAAIADNLIVSAFLLNTDGALVAQFDSPPFAGRHPMPDWQPGELVYDPRPLQIVSGTESLPPGEYTAAVRLYTFGADGGIVPVLPIETGDTPYVTLGTLRLP